MLSLVQMTYLIALDEIRNYQRAADACHITQPTLSMQVKKAEESLGHLVFDRSRNPLELTPYGQQLMPILRDILHEYERIEELNKMTSGHFQERIKIGIIPTIAIYLIPELYSTWVKENPEVKFEISELRTVELIQAIESKKIDLAIFAGPYSHDRLSTIPLYNEEILAYSHVEGKRIEREKLNQLNPWLLSSGNCLRNQMIKVCNLTDDPEQEWNYQGSSIDLLIKLVDQNNGYTLVPQFLPLPDHQKEHLKHIYDKDSETFPGRSVIAVASNRNNKWSSIEKIVRSVQLKYSNRDKLEIINWK